MSVGTRSDFAERFDPNLSLIRWLSSPEGQETRRACARNPGLLQQWATIKPDVAREIESHPEAIALLLSGEPRLSSVHENGGLRIKEARGDMGSSGSQLGVCVTRTEATPVEGVSIFCHIQ